MNLFGRKAPPPRGRRVPAGRVPARKSGSGRGLLETLVPGAAPRRARVDVAPAKVRLVDLCAEWLATVVALHRVAEIPDAAGLRARAFELKGRLEQDARGAGFAASDIDDAVFSLVAFLDESVLRTRGAARDIWISRSLQMELFGHGLAGEEFFTRLERQRQNRSTQIEALEVSYCCLAFGFAGRYGLAPEKLQPLMAAVESDIASVRGTGIGPLAPHAARSEERAGEVGEQVPVWLPLAVFIPAVLLWWVIVKLLALHGAGSIADRIGDLLPRS